MNRADLEHKLDAVQAVVELPDSRAVEELQDLLKHPGLPHLWSLLLGSRAAHHAALQYAPLGNMSEISRAAVLQGTIIGIELFRNTVLEQSIPSREDEGKEHQ